MADNRDLAALSGTVRTDDVGGIHYQGVKLTAGADGTAKDFVDGDQRDAAGYALWVVPRPMVERQTEDSASLTIATTAYITGDVLGAELTFASMARAAGGSGRITGAILVDDGDVLEGVDVFLFSETVAFGTDNGQPSISDADLAKCTGVLQMPGAIDVGGSKVAVRDSISIPYFCTATSLFAWMVTRDGHTFFTATDDLHLTLIYEKD